MKLREVLLMEMPNPAMAKDRELVQFDKIVQKGRFDQAKMEEKLKQFITKYQPLLNKVQTTFERTIKGELGKVQRIQSPFWDAEKEELSYKKGKFVSAIKPPKSIINKALERRKGFININDLVRGALLFETKPQADDFVKRFMRKNKNLVAKYEEKQKGQDKEYGYYGSHHLDLNIMGIIVELQIMTKKLWTYKDQAHGIYDKNRTNPKGPGRGDQVKSMGYFYKGNKKRFKECEEFEDWDFMFTEEELMDHIDFKNAKSIFLFSS